jgi:hypothetical protein
MIYPRLEVAILLAVFILIMTVEPAVAHDSHHHTSSVTVVEKTSQGASLGLAAASNQYYWGTHKPQWSVGTGGYNGESALFFGLGWRPSKSEVLFSGGLGTENGELGYSFGASGRF